MLYRFCPEIPKIPDYLVNLTENEIRSIPNKFNGVKASKYTLHNATKELEDFLRPYFDNDANIAFQVITDELPVHKDYGRTSCYNYIIKSGGAVSTVWYDDNLKEIDRVVFPTHVWHNINVEKFHNVVGVDSTRIAISVWTKDENAIGEIKT
jgi:hypothetical protein